MITLINRQRKIPIDEGWLKAVVQNILSQLDYDAFDLGILLTTNKTIQRYNETYRNKKGPTDILSFRYHDNLVPGTRIEPTTEEDKNLGDLVLSLEYIDKSSKELRIPFKERLLVLLIHGIVHLLGYDHETDEQYAHMKELEEKLYVHLPASLRSISTV